MRLSLSKADDLLSEDGMVHINYKPEETIFHLKHKLYMLKGYPVAKQQLCLSGKVIGDTRPIREFGLQIESLCLRRVNAATSAAAESHIGPIQSSHSYIGIEADRLAQQYLGNIGLLPEGSSFGSHTYKDIKAKVQSMQVLGDMASFPRDFGVPRKD